MQNPRLAYVWAAFLTVVAGAFALQSNLTNNKLPEPYHTPSANNRPQVIARPDGVNLSLPKGFQIDVYAEGFEHPRFMLLGPSKELLISDSAKNGAAYVVVNKEHRKIIEGLFQPYGLAFWKDYLNVAETTSLKRYKYDAKAMKVVGKGEELVSIPGNLHGLGII